MNGTRIASLRQERGWTQERLAAKSGVGIRTIQRLEAGRDASPETSSLVAVALGVTVRDLFTVLDEQEPGDLVDSPEAQQTARDRVASAWRLLYIGVGIVVTMLAFTVGQYGLPLLLAYWVGGLLVLRALRTLVLEPRLDAQYPLSRSRQRIRTRRPRADGAALVGDRAGR